MGEVLKKQFCARGEKLVILMSGAMGSGKDTVAREMTSIITDDVQIHAFAQPLREEVLRLRSLFPLMTDGEISQVMSAPQDEVAKMRAIVGCGGSGDFIHSAYYRESMILWGTMRRSQDSNYFVRTIENTINNSRSVVHIVTDVRFENEAHCANGILASINVPDQVRRKRLMSRDGRVDEWAFSLEKEWLSQIRPDIIVDGVGSGVEVATRLCESLCDRGLLVWQGSVC